MSSQVPFEGLEALLPIDFFSVAVDVPYAKAISVSKIFRSVPHLPDLCIYLGEEKFADFALVWNEEGLLGEVKVQKAFEHASFPDFKEGDSVEVFIDTRDMKKAGFATRFCHHFVFLAHEVQGIQAQEMTRFRSEDSHPLADASQITMKVEYGKKDYSLSFSLPASCLHGYDPQTFPRVGFTYKINRYKAPAQHFSVSSQYFDIAQHPSLWSSVKLTKP